MILLFAIIPFLFIIKRNVSELSSIEILVSYNILLSARKPPTQISRTYLHCELAQQSANQSLTLLSHEHGENV